jgi:hypothetical protein
MHTHVSIRTSHPHGVELLRSDFECYCEDVRVQYYYVDLLVMI